MLAAEGIQPPLPEQRAAVLVATGLVHLNRQEFDAAERLGRQALQIAIDVGLPHEAGDASTLLALVASWTGRWHDMFRKEFTASLDEPVPLSLATYCANLCFAEYHLVGGVTGPDPATYAQELLALADAAGSPAGRGLAQFMIGEACLLAGDYDQARTWLGEARRTNTEVGAASGLCMTLERLAQTEAAEAAYGQANELLEQAWPIAEASEFRSHLLVRLMGVAVEAAADPGIASRVIMRAERTLADSSRVCDPCSIAFRVNAARTCAGTHDLVRARRHLADAERIAGMWRGGPWTAAVWEARAAIRASEGYPAQASALLQEAADEYARAGRKPDELRCRAALI